MAIKFKKQLKGERLILKKTFPTIKTATEIFKVVDENREHLNPWFPWPKLTLKIEDSLKRFDTAMTSLTKNVGDRTAQMNAMKEIGNVQSEEANIQNHKMH
jgi:hypothetical protein